MVWCWSGSEEEEEKEMDDNEEQSMGKVGSDEGGSRCEGGMLREKRCKKLRLQSILIKGACLCRGFLEISEKSERSGAIHIMDYPPFLPFPL